MNHSPLMVWGQNLSNTLPIYIFISGWNENLTITISNVAFRKRYPNIPNFDLIPQARQNHLIYRFDWQSGKIQSILITLDLLEIPNTDHRRFMLFRNPYARSGCQHNAVRYSGRMGSPHGPKTIAHRALFRRTGTGIRCRRRRAFRICPGVFTHLAGQRQIIDMDSLYEKIRRRAVLNARQTPLYSDIRFAGHDDGDFVFAPR